MESNKTRISRNLTEKKNMDIDGAYVNFLRRPSNGSANELFSNYLGVATVREVLFWSQVFVFLFFCLLVCSFVCFCASEITGNRSQLSSVVKLSESSAMAYIIMLVDFGQNRATVHTKEKMPRELRNAAK